MTALCLKSTPDLRLVNCNYATQYSVIIVQYSMHSSVIIYIALIHYTCNYSANTLCTWGLIFWALLLLRISKPHLVLAGLSKRKLDNMCKNDGYRYFMHLSLVVISNSNSVYCPKYPVLKLSSTSCNSALILAHIIKNEF